MGQGEKTEFNEAIKIIFRTPSQGIPPSNSAALSFQFIGIVNHQQPLQRLI